MNPPDQEFRRIETPPNEILSPQEPSTNRVKWFHFVILGIVLGLGGFFLLLANPFGLRFPKPFLKTVSIRPPLTPPGAIAAPTPTLILPPGKQTFYVRGGDRDFSKITQIVVDPLDAAPNTTQTIDISITSPEPVVSFKVSLQTDNNQSSYTPVLKSGNSTKGVWFASYSFPDTAKKLYKFVFTIITNTNKTTTIPFLVR